MNNLQLAIALVLDPKGAMREIEARPRFLFPLLITMLVTVGVTFWYFRIVDFDWLIDATLRSNPRSKNLTEEQLAAATKLMTRGVLTWTSLIAVPFVVVIIRLLEALWYLLAGKVTKVKRSYKQWFALANWTTLPGVLAVLPAIPLLMTSKSVQMDAASAISPLSLNELFFHRGMGAPGYQLFTSLNLIQIFTVFLVVLGIKMWSGRSWLFALVYTLLPVALIGGVWTFLALR
jgi:Yip1 domain